MKLYKYHANNPIDTSIVQSLDDNLAVNIVGEVSLVGSMQLPAWDYVGVTYPDTVTEVFTFKINGASGTTVATITVVYTDNTKANLASATKVVV